MRTGLFTAPSLAVLALVGATSLTASAGDRPLVPPAPPGQVPFDAPLNFLLRRVVEIDGRFITVQLLVQRVIPGAPMDPIIPVTTVHVSLIANDGAVLPEDLDAVGVRFEKLRGENRRFFTRLDETAPDGSGGEEIDEQPYQGDLSDRRAVQRLRAVVRLRVGDEVVRVPMGTVRVSLVALP